MRSPYACRELDPGLHSGASSVTYTVAANDTAAALNATAIGLSGGATLLDQAHNAVAIALPGTNISPTSAIQIDGVAPVLQSITSTTPDGTIHAAGTVNLTGADV